MALAYFYQVDLNGFPIQGSNTALLKKPSTHGAGQRWVQYTPIAALTPCCSGGRSTYNSSYNWRYYVRVSQVTNLPISGTLEKRHFPPKNYHWMEIPRVGCGC